MGRRTMLLNARKLWREPNPTNLILLAIEDITNRKRSEEQALRSYEDSRQERDRLESVDEGSVGPKHRFEEIIGNSEAMEQVTQKVELVASTDAQS